MRLWKLELERDGPVLQLHQGLRARSVRGREYLGVYGDGETKDMNKQGFAKKKF